MRSYSWLVVISAFIASSHAWPEPPHFELQQTENTNAASAHRSVQGTCKRIAALTNLSNMVANQTRMDTLLADRKLTQEQVDYMETKKDAIKSELQRLSSNTTLVAECDVINAHSKAVKDCKKLDKLEKLAELANNKTAYDEHLAGEILNQKQTEQLKKNMEDAEIKLQELRSNSTLIGLCTDEIGLRQDGAAGQQAGDIGEAAVDNSGAISLSTSEAIRSRSGTWKVTFALASGTFIFFEFV
ncbi:hypothetical protein BU25DRAFT_421236 [Macroventuria anomochaeta]|uniref:Uncharacterized protein n=1 Tax=Macroventuria anomochaeta TaxID=301207 RepID=A0ACB6S3M1_9PLEO|nr:uncharacterized protein BU25DRAFT_421236 [Macroventuria anomochaeta]KAF2628255.1 hypothetical protein BU25DRAFT_421236 [Macroventuria anomochaeta]